MIITNFYESYLILLAQVIPIGDIHPGVDEEQNHDENPSRIIKRYKIPPLSLSIFERERDGDTFHTAQLQRAYTQDDGESFQYTDSLRPRDLRKAARLLEVAADDLEGLEIQEMDV